jgi:hypothetical protein
MLMHVYPASSRRNPHYSRVVAALRYAGHLVYDWSIDDFSWAAVPDHGDRIARLRHPIPFHKFKALHSAIADCDICVLILPAGIDAHAEFAHASGLGKRTFVLVDSAHRGEPDLMLLLADEFVDSIESLLTALARTAPCDAFYTENAHAE